jgi:integrase
MGDIVKRNGGYTLRWYEGGRRRTFASKQSSHQQARRMLLEIEARVARGEAGIAERRQSWPTASELIERFLSEYSRPRIKDLEAYRIQARSVLKRVSTIESKRSDQITSRDIAKLRDALGKELSPGSIGATIKQLSAVFGWAIKQGLAPHNPCHGVDRPIPAQNLDFLTKDEVQRLLDAAEQRKGSWPGRKLYTAIALAAYTGLRKGELFGLRWTDLDLETRRLTVARSYRKLPKGNKPRPLRLPIQLVPILREWRSHCPTASETVLPLLRDGQKLGGKNTMLGLPKLMESCGLHAVLHPWHLLRHTFASHFVMNGGNILALQKILGHSDLKMTMIYAHLAPDFLEGEMDKVRYF